MAKQQPTKFGYLKEHKHLQKIGVEFLTAVSEVARFTGYSNFKKTTDPETMETTWKWYNLAANDEEATIEVRGWEAPLFFYSISRDGEDLGTLEQPWKNPDDKWKGMNFTTLLLGWMGEVEFLKYRMDIQETLFSLKKMHPRGRMFKMEAVAN